MEVILMGECFTVDIETIKKNDYCLHPAHYKGRCPHHHKDRIRVEKLREKMQELQAEIDSLEIELQEVDST
jgi:type I restriction-modification system DNA methylase subunit